MAVSHIVFLIAAHAMVFGAVAMPMAQGNIGGVPVYNFDPTEVNVAAAGEKKEWILITKPGASDAQVKSVCADAEDCVAEGHPDEGGLGFSTVRATLPELEALAKKHGDDLEFMEPSMHVDVALDHNPSRATDYWNLDRIDAKEGMDGTYAPPADAKGGEGVHVYVLDTGIDPQHEEFEGRAVAYLDSTSGRVVPCSAGSTTCAADENAHGTHCAGTVGGKKSGVAKKVNLYGAKVLGPNGGSTSGIAAAMDYVMQNGKKPAVMSMSLGGPGTSNAFKVAVDKAKSAGITVVVAAGNSNDDACKYSPAFVPNAVTVGATGSTAQRDKRAFFSNFGRCIDIWAPGYDILSSIPGVVGGKGDTSSHSSYKTMSGTSMACPAVAGAVALLLGKDKNLSPASIIDKLQANAVRGIVTDAKSTANFHLYTGHQAGGDTPAPSPKDGGRRRRRRRKSSSRRRRRSL